jgi:uncharacterized protein YuzE
MELNYDPQRNVAYLRLRPRTTEVETVQVSDELNVDIAPGGTVYGIKLLNANEQLGAGDGGDLVVVNAALGERRELALGAPGGEGPRRSALRDGAGARETGAVPAVRRPFDVFPHPRPRTDD